MLAVLRFKALGLHLLLTASVLLFSALLLLITEILSAFKLLDRIHLIFAWSFVLLFLCLDLFGHRHLIRERLEDIVLKCKNWYKHRSDRKYILFFLLILFTLIGIQGFLYPPNNYDSMTYHLARIPNWMANASVAHYPTHIYRQLYQPPFSGYVLFHVNVLSGNDYFSNTVQLCFYMFTGSLLALLLNLFGLRLRTIGILLLYTLPAAILQASGSTNNIIDAYFIASAVYFAAMAAKAPKINLYFVLLGLSLGLAAMNKGTAYVYLLPLVILSGVFLIRSVFLLKTFRPLLNVMLTLTLFLSLTLAFYVRNYQLSGNLLGLEKTESARYRNEHFNVQTVFSNGLKNAALHIGPYPVSKWSQQSMESLHRFLGLDINDKGRNFDGYAFEVPDSPSFEDCAPNPLHMVLFTAALLFIAIQWIRQKKPPSGILIYILLLLLQVVVFSAYLKWQPWHSRNHIPFFVLSIPIVLYAYNAIQSRIVIPAKLIMSVLVFYALAMVLLNRTRPLINLKPLTAHITASDLRVKKYFVDRQKVETDFGSIIQSIDDSAYKRIGLILDWNEYEYPIFRNAYTRHLLPVHILVSNNPSSILNRKDADIDCIVSNKIYLPYVDYNGRRYFCRKQGSNFIALYTPEPN